MGISIKIAIMVTLFTYNLWAQNAFTEGSFSGSCSNLTVHETIEYIGNLTGTRFAYTSLSIDNNLRVNFSFENVSLSELLEMLHEHTGLKSAFFGSQVLLKREIFKPKRFFLTGTIVEQDSITPISYVTVSVSDRGIGTIADIQGRFELELTADFLNDTLNFSMIGYEPVKVPVSGYYNLEEKMIVLKTAVYEIKPVKVSSKDFKKIMVGNNRNIPAGSLYLDTNGQQAALLVENDKNVEGIILTINYYLSSSGNTDAPFRVRLYAVDSATGGPGDNLIKETLVVKPDVKRGWYAVNIRKFDIMVPGNGFFIAMEGVFPNDYDFYAGDDGFIDLTGGNQVAEDDITASVIYGQRLGYSRNKKDKNNTWHYSLSHTWFQLKKQPFGIMVSADVQIRKNKKN